MLIVLAQKGGSLLTRTPSGARINLAAGKPVEVDDETGAALIEAYDGIVAYDAPETAQDAPEPAEEAEADTDTATTENAAQEPSTAAETPKPKARPRAKAKPKQSGAISVSDLTAGGRKAKG